MTDPHARRGESGTAPRPTPILVNCRTISASITLNQNPSLFSVVNPASRGENTWIDFKQYGWGETGMTGRLGMAWTWVALAWSIQGVLAEDVTRTLIDGQGPGWRDLLEDDFTNVNVNADTVSWKGAGEVHITGQPVGVIRTKKEIKNVELVVQWRHMKPAGNSGIFLWVPMKSLEGLKPGGLPHGIEVQVLDLGYKDAFEKSSGKKADWFTCHGDVFSVGTSKMKPFPPIAPDGRRSFPTKELSKGVGQWNHYYVRAINGEVRLWVNGEEVSGGTGCEPSVGYLCLESEGSPVEFRGLRIRELP